MKPDIAQIVGWHIYMQQRISNMQYKIGFRYVKVPSQGSDWVDSDLWWVANVRSDLYVNNRDNSSHFDHLLYIFD